MPYVEKSFTCVSDRTKIEFYFAKKMSAAIRTSLVPEHKYSDRSCWAGLECIWETNVIQLIFNCVWNNPSNFIESPCVCKYCAQNVGPVSFSDRYF